MGVGSAISEKKHLEEAVDALTLIAGQKPVITLARQSIAGFQLREGMAIGCKVTLAGAADVRVPRPADLAGVAARARLPRVESATRSTATATTAWD